MIHVALRLDGPSVTSIHSLEHGILAALASTRTPATFAVIPFKAKAGEPHALESADVPHLVEAHARGRIEIAQHGYSHQPRQPPEALRPSEFEGVPGEEQERSIRAGRDQLERVFGITVTGFVPPWNTFDTHTEAVLERLGFRYLSAGPRLPQGHRLKALPRTCHISELPNAVAEARTRTWGDACIVALMHHYDFRESGEGEACIDVPWLEATLRRYAGDAAIRFVTLETLAATLPPSVSTLQRHRRRLPWPIQRRLPRLCLAWPHPRVFMRKA